MSFTCPHCRKELSQTSSVFTIGLRDTCTHCSADLHCCTACEFFDSASHHECREPQAEYVRDKVRANRCDYFRPTSKERGVKSALPLVASSFDDLFKKE